MKFNHISNIFFALILLISTTILIFSIQWLGLSKAHETAIKARYQLSQLANELKESSDLLTTMARSYTQTGDEKYKHFFNQIISIRDGQSPRPDSSLKHYWNIATLEGTLPARTGQKRALTDLLRDNGASEEELELLIEAKQNSDVLIKLEEQAFNAVEGKFKDSNGEYTIVGDPDLELGRALLYSNDYYQAKVSIMKPISTFESQSSARMVSLVDELYSQTSQISNILYLLLAAIFALILLASLLTKLRLLKPIDTLALWAKNSALTETPPPSLKSLSRNDEVSDLHNAFTELVASKQANLEKVKAANEKIQKFNHELEGRVKERTFALQKSLEETQKANKAKSIFLATMSHEFRTPLTSIQGALGMISSGKLGKFNDKISDLIDVACRNTKNLSELVDDILDLEKIDAGKMTFNFAEHSPDKLVAASIEDSSPFAAEHNTKIIYELDAPDTTIKIDTKRFNQVILNLLSNAIKFSSEANPTVLIRTLVTDNCYQLEVIDHGIGISKQFQKTLFKRFVQADNSDTRERGGSGLGLNICKSLVERMQGKIDCHSINGKGTTFRLEFPVSGSP